MDFVDRIDPLVGVRLTFFPRVTPHLAAALSPLACQFPLMAHLVAAPLGAVMPIHVLGVSHRFATTRILAPELDHRSDDGFWSLPDALRGLHPHTRNGAVHRLASHL